MRAERLALAAALLLAGCATRPPARHFGERPPREGAGPPPGAMRGAPPWAGGGGRARLFISPMGEPFRGGGPDAPAPAAAWFAGADTDHDGRVTRAEFEADALRFFATLDTDHDGEIGPAEIDRYEEEVAPEIRVGGGGMISGGRAGGHGRGGGGGRHGGGGGGGPGGGGMRGGGGHGGGGEGPPDGGGSPGGGDGEGGGGAARPGAQPLQGAARFGYLALPEPVIAADADFNRGVSRAEFVRAAQQRFLLLDRDGNGVLTEAELPRLGGR